MTDVFYDPSNKQMTIAVLQASDVSMHKEDDGSYLFCFENIEDVEFFWPDDRIWRAVK